MTVALAPPSQRDRDELYEQVRDDIGRFRNARIYITGGTGFVGAWFVTAILEANRRDRANISVDLLTRNPQGVAAERPYLLSDTRVRLVCGDVTEAYESSERYDVIVHAATPASAAINTRSPRSMLDTILRGGSHALAAARLSGRIPFLFTSSGAIYGPQPPALELIGEDDRGGPDPLDRASAYAEGKRVGELQCALALDDGVEAKVARLFAFVGPYLPLDRHFAVGNFLRDALGGQAIAVGGDGSPFRSYLYASDMTVWLWAVLARGVSGRAYNVGSEEAVDIATLAALVANEVSPASPVTIARERDGSRPAARYVPNVARIVTELGVRRTISLRDAIQRTANWHRKA